MGFLREGCIFVEDCGRTRGFRQSTLLATVPSLATYSQRVKLISLGTAVGQCCETQSRLLGDGRHCTQRLLTRYLVKLLF
jgi:hypothetical protein